MLKTKESGGRLYHDFPSKICCLKKFVEEPFCVSENFGQRKILSILKGYNYSQLRFFCLRVPIKFVGERFCVSRKSGVKFFMHRGGASRFCWKFFVSQDWNKKLRKENLLSFRSLLVWKKIIDKRGEVRASQFSIGNFFVSLYRKIS